MSVNRLWDIRVLEFATIDLSYRQPGKDPILNELGYICLNGKNSVIYIHFSKNSSPEIANF